MYIVIFVHIFLIFLRKQNFKPLLPNWCHRKLLEIARWTTYLDLYKVDNFSARRMVCNSVVSPKRTRYPWANAFPSYCFSIGCQIQIRTLIQVINSINSILNFKGCSFISLEAFPYLSVFLRIRVSKTIMHEFKELQ